MRQGGMRENSFILSGFLEVNQNLHQLLLEILKFQADLRFKKRSTPIFETRRSMWVTQLRFPGATNDAETKTLFFRDWGGRGDGAHTTCPIHPVTSSHEFLHNPGIPLPPVIMRFSSANDFRRPSEDEHHPAGTPGQDAEGAPGRGAAAPVPRVPAALRPVPAIPVIHSSV
ncbi:hypothetical protein CEXT_709201 [Caerostris extrusa]|uniref:Uncharacterized protein n=1 Tax=Caerostris extrusa TaxID=172846 RepID=A0AAV4YE45_CAEEX|nr:hypothetical protein CEXT_709201 [Caerostris extrusa]